MRICSTLTILTLLLANSAYADTIANYRDRPDAWFMSDEGKGILTNVLAWQTPSGGWWKSYDPTVAPPRDAARKNDGRSIFDNLATTTELRLLARAFRVTGDRRYRAAFDRGLAMTLAAQYPNRGWPQEYPVPAKGYAGHITFNDDAMTLILRLLNNIAEQEPDFVFVDEATRARANGAFYRGIDCILDCQIKVDGTLTAWCAQHDEKTLAPAKARAYELPSISGGESAGITLLLMSVDEPSDRVKASVQAAVAWFERAKLSGIRLDEREGDVVVVADPSAEPLWARFYDLETGKPFYCGRDGVKKSSLAEVGRERRTGYAWLRPWGQPVLAVYPAWAKKHDITR